MLSDATPIFATIFADAAATLTRRHYCAALFIRHAAAARMPLRARPPRFTAPP
jgi:hypothetical protein